MAIDIYCHILPPEYRRALYGTGLLPDRQKQTHDTVPLLWDIDLRLRAMTGHKGLKQVLTLSPPAPEAYLAPEKAAELSAIGNDELAALVARYPDQFVAGVAALPMNDIKTALQETRRAIETLHLKGIQVFTHVNGKPLDSPEFMPLWQKMAEYNLPVWLHPARGENVPDYRTENKSRYEANKVFGWPYDTTVAMSRFVFSGILEKYPGLKIITHHGGGMLPYFAGRMNRFYDLNKERKWGNYDPRQPHPPLEYFQRFYCDTALDGSTAALMCACAFFGVDHLLFGTDFHGEQQISDTVKSIQRMAVPDKAKKQILDGNATRLLGLTAIN